MRIPALMSGLLAVVLTGGIAGYAMLSSEPPDMPTATGGDVKGSLQAAGAQTRSAQSETASPPVWEQRVNELAERLLADYGDTIDQPTTQAYLYVEREKLSEAYPQDGRALFEAAVAQAFPDLSGSIQPLLANMETYHKWLADNELSLREMELIPRRVAVWQKREDIFGALASDIWAEEDTVASRNDEAVQQELARLGQAHELSPEEVVHQLSTTVDELYGLEAASQLVTPQALGQALFTLDSVQADLSALSVEDRQKRIDSLRRQLGYTDEQVARLSRQDQQRNARWQEGDAYMEQRRRLSQHYSGEQLDQALAELRSEHFGHAAATIAKEEQQGFYRFERERRYGVN